MYAVIRTGGKQYRVAPGDVVKVEKLEVPEGDTNVVFSDVLAVSGDPGTIAKAEGATVTAEVVREDRHPKILVFHLKRKKQYKKMQGHRQAFTEVRIKSIVVWQVCSLRLRSKISFPTSQRRDVGHPDY